MNKALMALPFIIAAALVCGVASAQVQVVSQDGEWIITGTSYEARIAKDGCLTSLKVEGKEFLDAQTSFSRGTYFYQGQLPELDDIKRDGNTITVEGQKAKAVYEFSDESMTWTVTNKTAEPLKFFAVFSLSVKVAMNESGQITRLPVGKDWRQTRWFQDGARLELNNGSSIWGPWEGNSQVWDCSLAANETRKIDVKAGKPTDDEVAKLSEFLNETTITKPGYEARVEADGCLASLVINGKEFLDPKVSFSRGTYFHQGDVQKLADIKREGDVVAAEGPTAKIVYEFGDNTMTWTVTNKTAQGMKFYGVFTKAVQAVMGTDGTVSELPTNKDWTDTRWFQAGAKLEIKNGTRIWGPWGDGNQVWDCSLAANETREIQLAVGKPTAEEAAAVAILSQPEELEANLTILSPRNLQVFQRHAKYEGSVLISGRVAEAADAVEARLSGKPLQGDLPVGWRKLDYTASSRSFSSAIDIPAGGWYKLEVRALNGGQTVAEAAVDKFGVGEVFIGAGQSNSTNCGQMKTTQTSGMVSNFTGKDWRIADDPQGGPHDASTGGSLWPSFGDALYAKLGVPIGVAPTGHGGTSTNAWQPDGELFTWMMTRIYQLGPNGFRAVIWHQGESDVSMSSDEYYGKLRNVVIGSKQAAGWEFPWFVAQVSYHNPENPSYPTVRDAQKRLWDDAVAMQGPDTDTLGGDNRDYDGKGIHFSPKGLKAHGEMWAKIMGEYIDDVLGD